jgi:hypothetical protein
MCPSLRAYHDDLIPGPPGPGAVPPEGIRRDGEIIVMNGLEGAPFRELPMVEIVTSARHSKRGRLDAFALDVSCFLVLV